MPWSRTNCSDIQEARCPGNISESSSLTLLAVGALGGPATAATVVTVAADGSGNFSTVQAAVNAAPSNGSATYEIDIKPGTYRGTVSVPAAKTHVTVKGLGSGRDQVVIVENHAASAFGTQGSATVSVSANDFRVENLTFSNDYDEAANGPSQAGRGRAFEGAAGNEAFRGDHALAGRPWRRPASATGY